MTNRLSGIRREPPRFTSRFSEIKRGSLRTTTDGLESFGLPEIT